MFGLSYLWHGVMLNDYARMNYPLESFLFISFGAYLLISAALTALNHYVNTGKKKILTGGLIGVVFGLFLYLIAFVLDISYHSSRTIDHILVDFFWQAIEQGFGGLCCGLVFQFYMDKMKMQSKQLADD